MLSEPKIERVGINQSVASKVIYFLRIYENWSPEPHNSGSGRPTSYILRNSPQLIRSAKLEGLKTRRLWLPTIPIATSCIPNPIFICLLIQFVWFNSISTIPFSYYPIENFLPMARAVLWPDCHWLLARSEELLCSKRKLITWATHFWFWLIPLHINFTESWNYTH